jgi:hypothetical protein
MNARNFFAELMRRNVPESRAHELAVRVCFAKSVVHLCGGFHDLSLHHRHYVCHVSTKFLHR